MSNHTKKTTYTSSHASNYFCLSFRVRFNRSWFVIHDEAWNFHDWILCYHEHFHEKIKREKSLELPINLWHLNSMKVLLTLWTLNYFNCVFLYWFFPHCSQSNQPIFKNLILKFPKNMIRPSLIWPMHLTLLTNLRTILPFMKSNGFVPLLNILHKNL